MLSKRKFLQASSVLFGLIGAQSVFAQKVEKFPMARTAIVFHSHSGNTRAVAQRIAAITGATIFEIVPEKPYPSAYRATTNQVQEELRAGYLPPIKPVGIDLKNFDVIVVGTPTWWHHVSRPVASWLTQTDLSGKTIMPFNTHGGGGLMQTHDDFVEMCPKSKITESLTVYGSGDSDLDNQILAWLKKVSR